MKHIKKQETWLPIFTGFYNSIFDESDSYIEQETELSEKEFIEYYPELVEAGITKPYFKENLWKYVNFTAGHNGAANYIADSLMQLEHAGIIKAVEYQELKSPKYYNFSNDSINCLIEYDSKKLLKYLKDNLVAFTEYIENKYTSRDGFRSHYSNEVSDWLDISEWSDHEVGSLLHFVLENENTDPVMDLYEFSNSSEGFRNSVEVDFKEMINDFKTNKGVA